MCREEVRVAAISSTASCGEERQAEERESFRVLLCGRDLKRNSSLFKNCIVFTSTHQNVKHVGLVSTSTVDVEG